MAIKNNCVVGGGIVDNTLQIIQNKYNQILNNTIKTLIIRENKLNLYSNTYKYLFIVYLVIIVYSVVGLKYLGIYLNMWYNMGGSI